MNEQQSRTDSKLSGKKKRVRWWIPVLAVVCVLGVAVGGVLGYAYSVIHSIAPSDEEQQFEEPIVTAPEFKGDVVNVLLVGMDFEEGRQYKVGKNGEWIGNTDMILYVHYDLKNSKMSMLQIPRDLLVTDEITCDSTTGNTYRVTSGKINGLAFSNDAEYAALADVIAHQLKLPVDYYAAINMQALKEMVDLFGGLDVYVPQDIADRHGNVLTQGYHRLDGANVEFLVRQRHAYANEDVGRLNTQRYFYSALFQRVRTATLGDIIKLMPVVKNYMTTNISMSDLVALTYNFLSIHSEDILVAQLPFYPGSKNYKPNPDKNFKGYWVGVPARQEIADLLNQYFRTYTGEVPAEALEIADDWPHQSGATSANVQFMGQLDEQLDASTAP